MSTYNSSRIVQYNAGCVIEAYGRSISGVYELPANYRNTLSVAPAAFVVGLNTMVLSIPADGVRVTTSFVLPTGFTASTVIAAVVDAVYFYLEITIDPVIPANVFFTNNKFGNRPFTLTFNTTSGTAVSVATKPSILPGRILVARGRSNQFSGNYNAFPLLSYPRLATDTSTTLGKIYLSGKGEHFPTCPEGLVQSSNALSQVFPGGLVEAYTSLQGMVIEAITAIDNNDVLHVECEEAGQLLAGRLTVTPTATTIPMPVASLFVTHGASLNQLAIVSLN